MRINELELHDLRCVVTLAEELSFGRAAERLHMSQPPLTRLVADLERALGVKLFERTTRRVAITPIGEVFAAEARAVLERVEEALQNVTEAVARQSGLLRLGYTPLALQTVLPRLLAGFREKEHDARIDLVELAGEALPASLEAGRIDLAFSDEPVNEPGYGNVLLHRVALSLAVPETHPLAARASVSLQDFGAETLILHPRHENPAYYDRIIAAFEAAGVAPNIYLRQAGQNCMALVVGGNGLLLTLTNFDCFHAPGLRSIPIEKSLPLYAEVWAAWVEKQDSGRIETLVEIVKNAACSQLHAW